MRKLISFIISIAILAWMWGTIYESIPNIVIAGLLAVVAFIALFFVIGLLIGIISNLFNAGRSDYSSYSGSTSYLFGGSRHKSEKPAQAGPAPAPTAASQQSWDERMNQGPILPPPTE